MKNRLLTNSSFESIMQHALADEPISIGMHVLARSHRDRTFYGTVRCTGIHCDEYLTYVIEEDERGDNGFGRLHIIGRMNIMPAMNCFSHSSET